MNVEELGAAIELIGVAWNLTPDAVTKSKKANAVEREATCAEEKEGTTHPAIYGEALPTAAETGDGIQPSDDDGDGVTAIVWALLKTATRLDTQEKREQLFESARFLETTWDLWKPDCKLSSPRRKTGYAGLFSLSISLERRGSHEKRNFDSPFRRGKAQSN